MDICWFVVSRFSGFGVGAVRGPAVRRVFRCDRWPSVSEAFWLAGLDTRFITCSKYGVWNAVFFTVCWFGLGILTLDTLRTNRRNRHLDGIVPNGDEWSGTI